MGVRQRESEKDRQPDRERVRKIGSQTERIDTTLQNHRAKIPITFYKMYTLYRRENYDSP